MFTLVTAAAAAATATAATATTTTTTNTNTTNRQVTNTPYMLTTRFGEWVTWFKIAVNDGVWSDEIIIIITV